MAAAGIAYEEVAAAVEGRADGNVQSGGEGALDAARGELLDRICASINFEEVAAAVEGQAEGIVQSRGESALDASRLNLKIWPLPPSLSNRFCARAVEGGDNIARI